ncbi:acyltransferase family protein [Marinimicrobium sp. ABcell2]|uniref:acyltransferase family protein n=1 Tax=Marinimicrobium sp. ABcell2 TaxID=3069751 RepID=UPI0027B73B7A|nr:acyltransferase family protein [Marinimicrobium sp. ABcell2]MDQ2076095.1 acyltransferase family protein [Marinimicrobium sp. ABcell2]
MTQGIHAPPHPRSSHQRRYDIDALRVFAFGLLIFYHVGMFYASDWHWHVKSQYSSEVLQRVMLMVNPWRMPLIFLVSGFASYFLLRKLGRNGFARSRVWRLLLPLLFGMVVIVPPQAYLQAVANGGFEGHYGEFLWRYLTLQSWPPKAFDGSDIGVTWNHLWYLPYLLTYSLILSLLAPFLRRPIGRGLVQGFQNLGGWQLFVVPVLLFVVYDFLLYDRFPATYAWHNDWHSHAVYFTAFILGYVMATADRLWRELQRLRWPAIVLAVSTYLLYFHVEVHEFLPTSVNRAGRRLLSNYNGWFWLLAVLGWAHHLLNRPFSWLPYATEAVFSWYILHQTITIVAGVALTKYQLGPAVEPLLVVLATVIGCAAIHEFAIRRWRLLRPLFGLKSMPAGETNFVQHRPI